MVKRIVLRVFSVLKVLLTVVGMCVALSLVAANALAGSFGAIMVANKLYDPALHPGANLAVWAIAIAAVVMTTSMAAVMLVVGPCSTRRT